MSLRTDTRPVEQTPTTLSGAVARMSEAEDTLRAIGAGEVDAFVVSDGGAGHNVFSLSSVDRPYRMFVENMRDGAATLSTSGLILFANQRLADLLSCPRETIVGSPLSQFVARGVPLGLKALRGSSGLGTTVEFDLVDANGMAVPVLVGTSLLDVEGDHLTCLTFTDLSVQKSQEREIARLGRAQAERLADLQEAQVALTEQATHDGLTGLPNRTVLMDRIDQALAHARRSGKCVAVLFVDLDRFKHINDTQGHARGDAVLKQAADRLVLAVRPMDTVARIGGDEFVVLATDVNSHVHALDMSTRLLSAMDSRGDRVEEADRIAASIGISVSVAGRGTSETLLSEADTAMYHSKSLGGGRAELFDPALRRQVQQRSVAQHMLQSALDEHRVIAHYQPIVDLASNTVVSFEALARIAERDGSILSPGAFVPIAEDSGLVVRLGAQVLTTACEAAKTWRPAEGMAVAVNLSSRQFEPGDLAALVHDRLARTGLDPSCLHLELTETAVMDLRPDLLLQLKKIRDLGVEVGLDDFGTGYASLTHLRRLPLTFVKIDQSFVQGLGSDRDDEGIVSAVVDLASNLGLRSIAEGVETADQLSRLRELGCDQAQGYLFARPVPPDDVADAVVRVPRPRITGPSGGTECVSIEPAAPFPILTPREREMLNLLADGLSGPTIAEQLFLSPATVRTHIRNAMVKLGAHTRGQAIAMVLRSEQIGS